MITVNKKIDSLKTKDVYSILMFLLFRAEEIPEYAVLSRLAYVMDKEVLLTLCELFGGMTIKIPTMDELEKLLTAMTIYSRVDLDKEDKEQVFEDITEKYKNKIPPATIIKLYEQLHDIMENYHVGT
jgi:hypothetical protein